MATLDVRTTAAPVITEIRFGEGSQNIYMADILTEYDEKGVKIEDSHSREGHFLILKNLADADNLIKAINEAKKLGWLK